MAEPLVEGAAGPDDPDRHFLHVNGNANGAALIGDRTRDCLPDPPHGISRDLDATAIIELLDRVHQPEIALLDQIEQLEGAAATEPLGNRYDQPQMRARQLFPGAAHLPAGPQHGGGKSSEFSRRNACAALETGERLAGCDMEGAVLALDQIEEFRYAVGLQGDSRELGSKPRNGSIIDGAVTLGQFPPARAGVHALVAQKD